jgi:hypothetical protein
VRQPDFELNGTLGVRYMDLKMRLSGRSGSSKRRADFFKANIATATAASPTCARGTWMFSPGFGLGLGYNKFIPKVDVH